MKFNSITRLLSSLGDKKLKGSNIVEYVITFALVGFVVGYVIYSINPLVFVSFFKGTFANGGNQQSAVIVVNPLSE